MPIETDSSNIDFAWRFKPEEGSKQEEVFFQLRLHKTTEYGWTISFLNEDGVADLSLPVSMFDEVSVHTRKYTQPTQLPTGFRKYGEGGKPLGLPQVGGRPPVAPQPRPQSRTAPTAAAAPRHRPAPTILPDGSTDRGLVKAEGTSKQFDASNLDIDEDFGAQEGVFLPPGHSIEDIELDENAPVFQSFTVPNKPSRPEPTVAPVDPQQEAQFEAAREAAKNNPKRRTGIRKRHTDKDE